MLIYKLIHHLKTTSLHKRTPSINSTKTTYHPANTKKYWNPLQQRINKQMFTLNLYFVSMIYIGIRLINTTTLTTVLTRKIFKKGSFIAWNNSGVCLSVLTQGGISGVVENLIYVKLVLTVIIQSDGR